MNHSSKLRDNPKFNTPRLMSFIGRLSYQSVTFAIILMNVDSLPQCFCAIFSCRFMGDRMLEVPGVYWIRSWTLSHFKRRQSTCAALKLRNSLLLDSCHIVLNGFMLLEVSWELISVQVRFQLENLSGNLLVLSFNPLQLRLPLIEV